MELIIKTIKGAAVRLYVSTSGIVGADVNGKAHTSPVGSGAQFDRDAITLSCNIRAAVNAADIDAIKDFFAAAKVVAKAWGAKCEAEYLSSNEASMYQMEARMYGKNSIH